MTTEQEMNHPVFERADYRYCKHTETLWKLSKDNALLKLQHIFWGSGCIITKLFENKHTKHAVKNLWMCLDGNIWSEWTERQYSQIALCSQISALSSRKDSAGYWTRVTLTLVINSFFLYTGILSKGCCSNLLSLKRERSVLSQSIWLFFSKRICKVFLHVLLGHMMFFRSCVCSFPICHLDSLHNVSDFICLMGSHLLKRAEETLLGSKVVSKAFKSPPPFLKLKQEQKTKFKDKMQAVGKIQFLSILSDSVSVMGNTSGSDRIHCFPDFI